jgi:hypothetical protein
MRCTRRTYLITLALSLLSLSAYAQERRNPFDPGVFISRVKIMQEWADGVFLVPSSATGTYSDSVMYEKYAMAFTMNVSDKDPNGWTLALQFDADRFGTLRLMRIKGWKRAVSPDPKEFEKILRWFERVLEKKIAQQTILPASDGVCWIWTQQVGYELNLERVHSPDRGTFYRLKLDRRSE